MGLHSFAIEQDGSVPNAELVIHGTVLTVDESQPTAEVLAVIDARMAAVGSRVDVEPFIGPDTEVLDIGDGCVMPGLVEAHGHPLMEAIALSDRLVDIRPVTIPDADDVVAAIKSEVAKRGADGAYLNGWDPLLQNGLPEPTLEWLDGMAPDSPLVIIHNSGHKAFFNSAAAARSGLTRDTADPKGAKYGRGATVSWTAHRPRASLYRSVRRHASGCPSRANRRVCRTHRSDGACGWRRHIAPVSRPANRSTHQ